VYRCFLRFTGKPLVVQPDDSFDDNAYGRECILSNPQALLREERRAVAVYTNEHEQAATYS